jgi:hypothetical protein
MSFVNDNKGKLRIPSLPRRSLTATHSAAACCTVPPVQAEYTPKGRYEVSRCSVQASEWPGDPHGRAFQDIEGLHTYVTGPADAATAILFVFDIFKFSAQGLQGELGEGTSWLT